MAEGTRFSAIAAAKSPVRVFHVVVKCLYKQHQVHNIQKPVLANIKNILTYIWIYIHMESF